MQIEIRPDEFIEAKLLVVGKKEFAVEVEEKGKKFVLMRYLDTYKDKEHPENLGNVFLEELNTGIARFCGDCFPTGSV